MPSDKPRVLILGGTGFVARHLVKYLVDNNLASKIRVADKQLPKTGRFIILIIHIIIIYNI